MRTAARAFGLVVVFLTAIVAALVIHIDVPATRRVLRGAVNQQLAATFKGEVALGEIERIGADHVRVASFSVSTPEGQRVLQVDELAIEGPWLSRILGAVLAGGGIIDPGAIRVARTELTIERDEAGTLGLVRAFEPRKKPTPPTTIEAPKPSAYAVRLGDVELASVRVIADLPFHHRPGPAYVGGKEGGKENLSEGELGSSRRPEGALRTPHVIVLNAASRSTPRVMRIRLAPRASGTNRDREGAVSGRLRTRGSLVRRTRRAAPATRPGVSFPIPSASPPPPRLPRGSS